MGKLPYQLIINTVSFLGVGGLVFWTSNGGLRKHIHKIFGSDASSSDLKDRVGHISDMLYYYALFVTTLIVLTSLIKIIAKVFPKLQEKTPTVQSLKQLFQDEVHNLVIFAGIYVYLIYNDGMGLKNKEIVLFPYWFLLTVVLDVLGRVLTSLSAGKIIFTRASFYLYFVLIIMMLSQIAGYRPFKSI